jgi:ketosteroid isomerase-like protein
MEDDHSSAHGMMACRPLKAMPLRDSTRSLDCSTSQPEIIVPLFKGLVLLLVAAIPASIWATEPSHLLLKDATWNELRLKADVQALDQLLADDWLLTHSDGRVQTKAEYLNELSSRSRTNQAITNEDVSLRSYGDAAVITGVSVQSGVSNGKPWSGRFRFTRVWVLRDDRWIMAASHSSRITLD